MIKNHQKNIATFIHLSTFSRFFIPFGNFIGPILLWSFNKNKSEFIDNHGKEVINFQLSILLYTIILGIITIPVFLFNFLNGIDFIDFHGLHDFNIKINKPSPLLYIGGFLGIFTCLAFILELAFIVLASLKAREGEQYQYPITINFLK